MTYYDILFSFFIYGFLGWCSEVAFAAFKPWISKWSDLSDLWNWSDGCRCFSSALRRKLDLALYYLHHSRYFS